jgi:hypothetical protein
LAAAAAQRAPGAHTSGGPPGRPPLPLQRSSSLPAPCVAPLLPPLGHDGPMRPPAGLPRQVGGGNAPPPPPLLRAGSLPAGGWCPPGGGPPRPLPLHPVRPHQQPIPQERLHIYGPGSSSGLPPPPGYFRLPQMPPTGGGPLPVRNGLPLGPRGCPPPLVPHPGPNSLHRGNSHTPPLTPGAVGGAGALPGMGSSSPLPLGGMVGGAMPLPLPLFRPQQQAAGRAGMDMPPPAMGQPPVPGGFGPRAMPPAAMANMHSAEQLALAGGYPPPQQGVMEPHSMQHGSATAGASSRRAPGQLKRPRSTMAEGAAAGPAKVPATPQQRAARLVEGGMPPQAAQQWAPAPAGGVGTAAAAEASLLDSWLEAPTLEDLDLLDLEGLGDPLSGPLLGVLDDLPPLELGDITL